MCGIVFQVNARAMCFLCRRNKFLRKLASEARWILQLNYALPNTFGTELNYGRHAEESIGREARYLVEPGTVPL